jgi:hypothetical protein
MSGRDGNRSLRKEEMENPCPKCQLPCANEATSWPPPGCPLYEEKERMMTIVNLTPHAVKVLVSGDPAEGDAEWKTFPPSGDIARVGTEDDYLGTIDGNVPIFTTRLLNPVGLPDPRQDTFYVVSRVVFAACPERNDLLCPYNLLRDSEGRVVGCKGLSR